MLWPVSLAFCWANASMVPSSSTGRRKSLNFTAAFISSRSVTVPWVASRSPSRMSPRPSRSKAMRMPSPCLASSMPCFTMSPISSASPASMPAPLVIRLPPNTCSMPLSLSPLKRPLPPVFFISSPRPYNSCLASLMRCCSVVIESAIALAKSLCFCSSVSREYVFTSSL